MKKRNEIPEEYKWDLSSYYASENDYENVFMLLKNSIGERYKDVHIHFSKIEYGKKGEIRHLTFEDKIYGPEFEALAKILKKLDIKANIICESRGTQTKDAIEMQNIFFDN